MTYDQMAERLASDVAESRRFSFYKLTRPYKQADEIVAALRRAAEVEREVAVLNVAVDAYLTCCRSVNAYYPERQAVQNAQTHVRRLLDGEGGTTT